MATDTAFSRAVREFIATPSKKKKASFIDDVLRNRSAVKALDVQDLMEKMEADSLQTHEARKFVRPVFNAMLDYAGVVECLCQADPMPTALVWGGMKAVLECFRRYTTMIDKIGEQMKRLGRELRRMKAYEKLFADSTEMQQQLTQSYLAVIRFWVRVETQCKARSFVVAASALTSSATTKLDEILAEISENGDSMAKLLPIVQERIRRGEHEDAAAERRKAGLALADILENQKREREARRKNEVRQWITGGAELNESNFRHRDQHESALLAGTGTWLLDDARFQRWRDPGSDCNVLWLHGGMAVGKSVACANAARTLRGRQGEQQQQNQQQQQQQQPVAVVVQYFSFDENEPLLRLYRNIAAQLFDEVYYLEKDEMSSHIYDGARGLMTVQSLKEFIEALVAETQTVFVLVDGLDEECAGRERWQAAKDVVDFLLRLARQKAEAEPAADSSPNLKLWCSSQDRCKVRKLLAGAEQIEQIELTAATNSEDIAAMFADALRSLSFDQGDGEAEVRAKTAMLQSLRRHVDGNFLWARLMVDATTSGYSLSAVQKMLDDGLPGDFDAYLRRKIRSLDASQHCLFAKVFSCLVYAKRPLLLNELWEALEIGDRPAGQDLKPLDYWRRTFLDNCAPLVRSEEIVTGRVCKELCTLSHGSIRSFLKKNPDIFSPDESCLVTSAYLAHACKKYLQQPRYSKPLVKVKGSFLTACGQDIDKQHLLGYCAKYWHRHMDDLTGSPELCRDVEQFVRSPHYFTCMQVQSILVGGQFAIWRHSGDASHSLHLVRVFPRWFTENKGCGNGRNDSLLAQYHVAIGEWGYYLDEVSNIHGLYPGQVHRCWWRSLGKANFLHDHYSSVKNFVFEKSEAAAQRRGETVYLAEGLNADRSEMRLFKLNVPPESDGSQLQLLCERWSIRPGHRPKLRATSELMVPSDSLERYWSAEHKPLTTVAPIAVSECGTAVRVGAEIYREDDELHFTAEDIRGYEMDFAEDIARKGDYIAIASRGRIVEEVEKTSASPRAAADQPSARRREGSADRRSDSDRGSDSRSESSTESSGNSSDNETESDCDNDSSSDSDSDSDSTSNQKSSGLETDKGKEGADAEAGSDGDGLDSDLDLEDGRPDDDLHDFDSGADSDSTENSARESWSEGSTDAMSDEIDDDFVWNEFKDDFDVEEDLDSRTGDASDAESGDDTDSDPDMQLEDKAPDNASDVEDPDTSAAESSSGDSVESSPKDMMKRLLLAFRHRSSDSDSDSGDTSHTNHTSHTSHTEPATSSDESDVESQGPSSSGSESANDSDDSYDGGAGLDVDMGAVLQAARGSRQQTAPRMRPCRLCIVRRASDGDGAGEQVFHFLRRAAWPLYASPPVFHPTRPLLVWPLGGNEILFVHYAGKTYFSRVLSSNYAASCEISVQARFSACGRYLHLAALHGYSARLGASWSEAGGVEVAVLMGLRLQLSTYRLSQAKLERSPPRLVHRCPVDLDMFYSPSDRLSLSQLPVTLSWTPRHLYIARNERTLRILRVPLYTGPSSSSASALSGCSPSAVTCNTGDVYLPTSVGQRKVYFAPAPPADDDASAKTKKKAKAKDAHPDPDPDETYVATVLLGAQNTAANTASNTASEANSCSTEASRAPPQGAHLTAAQLGSWTEALPGHAGSRDAVQGPDSAVAPGGLRRAETWRGGQLLARYEKFDRNDDCDIVPYIGT